MRALIALLGTLPLLAWADSFICPQSISISEHATAQVSTWEAFESSDPHYFDRVAIYFRHPKKRASQVPDNDDEKGPPFWTFPRKASNEYWLACTYLGTNVMFVKQLSAGYSQCVVVTDGVSCK